MSAENIKTWPEAVFLRPHYPDNTLPTVNFNEYHFGMTHDFDRESDADIKYIRADIAAEREEKLIAAAYAEGVSDQNGIPFDEPVAEYWPVRDDPIVYGTAGLEKLK